MSTVPTEGSPKSGYEGVLPCAGTLLSWDWKSVCWAPRENGRLGAEKKGQKKGR